MKFSIYLNRRVFVMQQTDVSCAAREALLVWMAAIPDTLLGMAEFPFFFFFFFFFFFEFSGWGGGGWGAGKH